MLFDGPLNPSNPASIYMPFGAGKSNAKRQTEQEKANQFWLEEKARVRNMLRQEQAKLKLFKNEDVASDEIIQRIRNLKFQLEMMEDPKDRRKK